MADDHRTLDLERVQQAGEVLDHLAAAVGAAGDQRGRVVAAQVRGDGPPALGVEPLADDVPGRGQVGEAVHQHDEGTLAVA